MADFGLRIGMAGSLDLQGVRRSGGLGSGCATVASLAHKGDLWLVSARYLSHRKVIKGRLERFVVGVLETTRPLLSETDGRDIAVQLRRSAAAVYSNYGSACVARSHADFTSKIGIAFEEADESRRWLRLLKAADLLHDVRAEALIREAGELRAILSSAHLTAKRNRDKYRRQER